MGRPAGWTAPDAWSMFGVEYVDGGVELLDAVRPLWEELNERHARLSAHFRVEFGAITFDGRKEGLLRKSRSGSLRVDGARLRTHRTLIAYCISSMDTTGRTGEIDSLFVQAAYRQLGIGDALMRKALAWLDGMGVRSKVVGVAVGNERALAFYARYGFLPRSTILMQRSDVPEGVSRPEGGGIRR